ncbi:MAG: hypothetical protein ACK5XN_21690 [Bacteroidota bacterium]|jgi:hypothetical protein
MSEAEGQDLNPSDDTLRTGQESSPWYPQFDEEVLSAARQQEASGNNRPMAAIRRIADQRLELRAIKERWPIPQDVREQLVIQAAKMAFDPTKEARYKVQAWKILLAMDSINRVKGLPDQVQINVQGSDVRVSVHDVLRTIEEDPKFESLMDAREFKVEPGSTDDYAE